MSIIVSDLSYHHPNRISLFECIGFSISEGSKAALIGDNGTGKSTLLRLIAGEFTPTSGSVFCISEPYYIPQNIGVSEQSIAGTLKIADKLTAIEHISKGSTDCKYFDALNDDWEIETRSRQALDQWGLSKISLTDSLNSLSGGERTKLFLAGISIHQPQIIVLDEPTNHLDSSGREMLYDLIRKSNATFLIVSHDITLLNLLEQTYELSSKGIKLYGGDYCFYREQKDLETAALAGSIETEQKAFRLARRKAQEARERQQKRESAGGKAVAKRGQPRIIANAKANKGEATGAKLQDIHQRKIEQSYERLAELRQKQTSNMSLRIDFDDGELHCGKLLFAAESVSHEYIAGHPLWQEPLDFTLYSGDRVHLKGDNGSGKTTLIRILTGELKPTFGNIRKTNFSYVYLDQNYSHMDSDLTVAEMAESFNFDHLAEHEIKMRLSRALFPKESWGKSCRMLSGGERVRLHLCCLMISNHIPDLFILDEPTNNLDITSLSILTDTIKNYRGSVVVVSHDKHFVNEIDVNKTHIV